jgi:hypothetical protein
VFLNAEIVTKIGILFVVRWNLVSKTQVLTFLGVNLYKIYPSDNKFLNSEYFFWLLDPKIVTKSAIRCILGWNLLNKTQGFLVGLCMGDTLRMSNFKTVCICFGSWTPKYYQKWHQICSTVKFVEQNFHFPILSRNLYGRYLWTKNLKILSTPLSFKYKISL